MKSLPSRRAQVLILLAFCLTFPGIVTGLAALPPGSEAQNDVFLPTIIGGGAGGSDGDLLLNNGETVTDPDGVTIGAVRGALSEPLPVSITAADLPNLALPGGAMAYGSAYHISAQRDEYAPGAETFILGLPLPAGTPLTNLGIALYEPPDELGGASWSILTGRVDTDRNLMLVALPHLASTARTAVLIAHPALRSPINNFSEALAPSTISATDFEAICVIASDGLRENCEIDKVAVEDELKDNLGDLTSIGYPEPLLYTQAEAFNIDSPTVIQGNTYVVIINTAGTHCNADTNRQGYYLWRLQQLNLCIIPSTPLSDAYKRVIAHEYFHATQAAFPGTWADFTGKTWERWIIEGTASASEESDENGMKRTPDRALHYVDHSLKSEEGTDAYKAQDFWVFLGQLPPGSGLDRYIPLLQQGADTGDVTGWIGSEQGLKNNYWRWVKNQVMVEDSINFDNKLGRPCLLQNQVVETLLPFDPYKEGFYKGSLEPLSSDVIKMTIDPAFNGRFQLWVWINAIMVEDPDLKYKVYRNNETCTSVPDGFRKLPNPNSELEYYIVVSNTNPDVQRGYTVYVE